MFIGYEIILKLFFKIRILESHNVEQQYNESGPYARVDNDFNNFKVQEKQRKMYKKYDNSSILLIYILTNCYINIYLFI